MSTLNMIKFKALRKKSRHIIIGALNPANGEISLSDLFARMDQGEFSYVAPVIKDPNYGAIHLEEAIRVRALLIKNLLSPITEGSIEKGKLDSRYDNKKSYRKITLKDAQALVDTAIHQLITLSNLLEAPTAPTEALERLINDRETLNEDLGC